MSSRDAGDELAEGSTFRPWFSTFSDRIGLREENLVVYPCSFWNLSSPVLVFSVFKALLTIRRQALNLDLTWSRLLSRFGCLSFNLVTTSAYMSDVDELVTSLINFRVSRSSLSIISTKSSIC